MVYFHHFNEMEEMARAVEAAFPNVVCGVANGDPEGENG